MKCDVTEIALQDFRLSCHSKNVSLQYSKIQIKLHFFGISWTVVRQAIGRSVKEGYPDVVMYCISMELRYAQNVACSELRHFFVCGGM